MQKTIWSVRHSILGRFEFAPRIRLFNQRRWILARIERACAIVEKIGAQNLDVLYTSPYRRAVETSFVLASKFPRARVEITPALAETLTETFNNCKNISVPASLANFLFRAGITIPEPYPTLRSDVKSFATSCAQMNFAT